MSEPEELLIEAAHAAAVHSAALWRRLRPASEGPPGLAELRARLEIFLGALCPDAPPIFVAEPPAVPTWLARIARRSPPHLIERRALASTDGSRLRLPRRMDAASGLAPLAADLATELQGTDDGQVPQIYRVVAIGQALRARRGSSRGLPAEAVASVRDLYAILEAAAVDRELALLAPGLVPALVSLRRRVLAERPQARHLSPAEREVERLLNLVLSASAEDLGGGLPGSPSPSDSLAWARSTSSRLVPRGARYRGLPAIPLWGRLDPLVHSTPAAARTPADDSASGVVPPGRTRSMVRRPRVRGAGPDEDDEGVGAWHAPTSDRQESVEDPMGLRRPPDRDDDADPDDLADTLSDLPVARLVTTPDTPREVLSSEDPPPAAPRLRSRLDSPGIAYPEWDWRSATYLPDRARVRLVSPPEGSATWADVVLREHGPLVRETRRRFDRLRMRRVRRTRQSDGSEVDLDAYVEARADMRAGHATTDRLYIAERPSRRELALLVLVDASASTDAWVDGNRRVIDVEKEALLLVCEGLEALGDRYAVLAFSGEGPESVQVSALKDFGARYDAGVRRAIAGLEPDRYTRLGAALRHATAVLARERAQHRLLLLLSDGKPNDVDHYEGRYGVEDARQAVCEARTQCVRPFCLTVDRESAAYAPRIFGRSGFTVLRQVRTLPIAVLEAVRHLIR